MNPKISVLIIKKINMVISSQPTIN